MGAADRQDRFCITPVGIPGTIFFLAHQPPSAWSFPLVLRPFEAFL